MIVQMEKTPNSKSNERAQQLYNKVAYLVLFCSVQFLFNVFDWAQVLLKSLVPAEFNSMHGLRIGILNLCFFIVLLCHENFCLHQNIFFC